MEITYLIGIVLALSAAIGSASSSLFIRFGTQRGEVKDAALITMVVNLCILGPIVLVRYYPEYGLSAVSWVSFAAAGIAGTVLGRMFKFTSIQKIGASRTEPVFATWVLFATVLGVIFLGETLTPMHGLGIVLIVGGVTLLAWESSKDDRTDLSRRELLLSLVLPLAGAVALGAEPIFASFGLEAGTPAPIGLVVKLTAAMVGMTLYLWWANDLPTRRAFRPETLRWNLLAGVTTTVFLLGYYIGLEIAPVNVVVPIIATNTMFVVLLSAVFMPNRLELVTRQLVTAAAVVVSGVVLISVYG